MTTPTTTKPAGAGEAREIDTGMQRTRYARGWHCIGLAEEFRDGEPHGVEAFGTKIVVWSNAEGEINVLDGYCRHLGGDLTQGSVKDGNIACPFHDWRWGGDGKCKGIPYAKRVPLRARTKTWTTMERNGQLFVWHDHEGKRPTEEDYASIPVLAEAESDEWTDWVWNSLYIDNAPAAEIVDNVVDMAHFFYIHYAFPTYFKNVFEGQTAAQYLNTRNRPDKDPTGGKYGETKLESIAAYYGPSYMINPLTNFYGDFKSESILINCHYPVTQNSFVLMYGLKVHKPKGLDDASANAMATKVAEFFGEGFLQDVRIWQNKTGIANPLLCEEDGPVYQLRRWYDQFYVDREDVTEEMTQRFEFEVDTSAANEYWEKEVAENLRVQEEEKAAAAATAEAETGADSGANAAANRSPSTSPSAASKA